LRRLELGAGIAVKLTATFLKLLSSLANLTAVDVVTNINNPLPTFDVDIYAFLSLSLMAGVRVVNEAK